MKFTHISKDPDPTGTYIARTANGWFWYWAPRLHKWLLLDEDDDTPSSEN